MPPARYAQTKSTNILDVVNDAILSKKGYWREDEWVWNWVWRRSDLSGRAVNDVHNLSDLVQYFRLKKDTKDTCKWRLNDGGSFTVKGLRDLVDSKILELTGSIFETSWCKLIPKKVCIFVCRLYHKRIPTLIVLDNMGIDLHSVLCPCCEESSESLDHCFVTCPKVKPIWDRVFEWWGVGMQNLLSVEDVRNIVEANAFTGLKKRNGKGLFDLFKEVQGRVFEWIATRLKKQPDVGGLDQWFDYSSYVRTKVHT
ncbi:RNA-directed DNA polymerase, eukaryota, reverse transcriptase zinc-binding domain protein [Tanacetum coccineum]